MPLHLNRLAVTLTVAVCMALSATTSAFAGPMRDAVDNLSVPVSTAKVGDTPADFGHPPAAATAVKVGDTPATYPGASRSPQYTPPTAITINRPERTIVQNPDQVVPILLASLALLLALAGLGTAARTRGRVVAGH